MQAPHEIFGEAFGGRVARGNTIHEAHQAASRTHPEGAAAIDRDADDPVIDELGQAAPVEGLEADAVEPDEANLVREPQVPRPGSGRSG